MLCTLERLSFNEYIHKYSEIHLKLSNCCLHLSVDVLACILHIIILLSRLPYIYISQYSCIATICSCCMKLVFILLVVLVLLLIALETPIDNTHKNTGILSHTEFYVQIKRNFKHSPKTKKPYSYTAYLVTAGSKLAFFGDKSDCLSTCIVVVAVEFKLCVLPLSMSPKSDRSLALDSFCMITMKQFFVHVFILRWHHVLCCMFFLLPLSLKTTRSSVFRNQKYIPVSYYRDLNVFRGHYDDSSDGEYVVLVYAFRWHTINID